VLTLYHLLINKLKLKSWQIVELVEELGLDCFNEQDCLEISNRQYQDEQIIHQLEEYVKVLQYRLEVANISIPSIIVTETPLVLKPIVLCETNHVDYLPF
jgi:hypothetical protein